LSSGVVDFENSTNSALGILPSNCYPGFFGYLSPKLHGP